MMAVGACGLMNAVGNLRPRVLADLCDAVWKNDLARAQALHQALFEINQAVFFDTNPIPMKYMMNGCLRKHPARSTPRATDVPNVPADAGAVEEAPGCRNRVLGAARGSVEGPGSDEGASLRQPSRGTRYFCIGVNYPDRNEEYKDGSRATRSTRASSFALTARSYPMKSR